VIAVPVAVAETLADEEVMSDTVGVETARELEEPPPSSSLSLLQATISNDMLSKRKNFDKYFIVF